MITFNSQPGVKRNRTKAINISSVWMPAFEKEHGCAKFLARFASAPDRSNISMEELGIVVIDLIQRYAVFEMYHPNGYSIKAHITSLHAVMTSVTSCGMFGLIGILGNLGICHKELEV